MHGWAVTAVCCAQVWQADPLLQAPQAPTATATPSGDDDAATSAAVRQALLGDEPLATAAAAEGRADEVVMRDADVISGADGGGRAAVGDPPVTDSGAADSLARLSLSGGSGSGGGGSGTARLVSHAIGEPPGDAEQRRRRGLFLLEEPVTWSALQSLSMDQGRGMLSLDQPGGRAVLNKKQGVLRTLHLTAHKLSAPPTGRRFEWRIALDPMRWARGAQPRPAVCCVLRCHPCVVCMCVVLLLPAVSASGTGVFASARRGVAWHGRFAACNLAGQTLARCGLLCLGLFSCAYWV